MPDIDNSSGSEVQSASAIEQIGEKHKNQIVLIEKKNTDTVMSLIRSYERQLKENRLLYEKKLGESDALLHNALNKLEKELKGSLTWRIGWAITSSVVLALNFVKNPYQFCTNQRYRWKDLYYFPSVEKDQKPVQQQNTLSNNPVVKRDIDITAEIDPGKLTVMCVFDTFTKTCFEPEFNVVCPTPDNWKQGFEKYSIDAVFIESAWHGNDNSWETLTVNFGGLNKLETMKNLISTARSKGIPAIFWNKEDPVHFNGFIDTAKMMDYVFTSDAESVPKYLDQMSHRNVYSLPFAAQHKVHNPVREHPRNKTVSFAGSYYNFSFAERKLDLDILLKPAMAFGLEIYDRNFGATGLAAEEYKFPDVYKPAIKGKLAYQDMLEAYKTYKVFLNVNSVKYSSTMFARRVFELLACGTPVISNYSKGIVNMLGEDTVFITESEDDTRKYLEQLLGNEHFWWKQSLHGMRKVMEHHTYQDRSGELFAITGHAFRKPDPYAFLMLASISSLQDAKYLIELAMNQQFPPAGVVLVAGQGVVLADKELEAIQQTNTPFRVEVVPVFSNPAILKALSGFTYSHLAKFSANHFYGKNYLRDFNLAVKYADAKVLGKQDHVLWKEGGSVEIPLLKSEYHWVNKIPTDTLVVEKSMLNERDFCVLINSTEFGVDGVQALSLDPFNYLHNGRDIFLKDRIVVAEQVGI